jgi:hypothetical protein
MTADDYLNANLLADYLAPFVRDGRVSYQDDALRDAILGYVRAALRAAAADALEEGAKALEERARELREALRDSGDYMAESHRGLELEQQAAALRALAAERRKPPPRRDEGGS